mgnify:CR=1 FL=1
MWNAQKIDDNTIIVSIISLIVLYPLYASVIPPCLEAIIWQEIGKITKRYSNSP